MKKKSIIIISLIWNTIMKFFVHKTIAFTIDKLLISYSGKRPYFDGMAFTMKERNLLYTTECIHWSKSRIWYRVGIEKFLSVHCNGTNEKPENIKSKNAQIIFIFNSHLQAA